MIDNESSPQRGRSKINVNKLIDNQLPDTKWQRCSKMYSIRQEESAVN